MATTQDGDRLLIDFKGDIQYPEIRAYSGHLPQTVKHKVKGRTIVIEASREFNDRLGNARSRPKSWIERLTPSRRGK